ncbi:MAG: ABC transporter substrate-binding protein [Chloroflexota bacterium]|nr:ABC transporter substrate-binding protein [Chloroflexota bacterium]
MASDIQQTDEWWAPVHGRRTVLRGALLGGVGLAAAALVGCGGDDDDDDDAAAPAAPAAATAVAAATEQAAPDASEGLVTPAGNVIPLQFPEPAGVTPKAGGVLKQAVAWNVGPIDPTVSAAGGTIAPGRAAYNRVIGFVSGPDADPYKIEFRPELAASWERAEDGLSYTFHLNEGVKFHNVDPTNGRDFTAADVKFAWDRYAAGGAQSQYFTAVRSIEAADDHTVVVNMISPQPDFLTPIASRYLTIHPREIVDDGTIEQRAIGTGPMIMKEATPAERVLYEKNPDYWEKEVLLDGLEHLVMQDQQARRAAMRVNQVDHAMIVTSTVGDLDALLETNPDVKGTWSPTVNAGTQIAFNMKTVSAYQDERVRRALSVGLDRQFMIDIAYEGYGAQVSTLPWFFLFDEAPTPESGLLGEWWGYRPDEAKKLLQAAGAENLSFEMIYHNYAATWDQLAEILQEQFGALGVNVEVTKLDYTSYNSQLIQVTYEDVIYGWSANGFDADTFFYAQIHSGSAANRYNIEDPQIDAWAEAQKVELDPEARKELHRNIWDRIHERVYRIDMPAPQYWSLYQPWLRNVRFVGPLGINYSFTEIAAQVQDAWLDK